METTFIEEYDLFLEVEHVNMLNYSLTQNELPLIKKITIHTNSEENIISNIKVKIYSNTKFIQNFEQVIPTIDIKNAYSNENININYNYNFLEVISERVNAYLYIDLIDENESTIFSKSLKVNILPSEHWLGTNIYPQLTASYILPNDAEVKRIVAEASAKLEEWTGDPSFYGYQSENMENIRLQVAAIYATLQKENIAYKNPPASFESFGQKIRYPQEMIKFKNGTCLDLAFLFASCIESIGINPLIIFIKGHAFIGFWLKNQNLVNSYSNDYTDISKRISKGMKEIEIIETTAYVNGKDYSFEQAIQIACHNLDNSYNFECIIDITSCRHIGIHPVATNNSYNNFKMKFKEREYITDAPTSDIEQVEIIDYKASSLEKTDIWSRNLLDLTLRNSLINFKMNKSAVQLLVYDIASLEDELASSSKFTIIAKPENLNTSKSNEIFYKANSIKLHYKNLVDADFKENRIRSFLTDYMLKKHLKDLYRRAKTALEENGSNSLFLAIGFLSWNDQKSMDTNYIAPILLLPLSIERKTASSNIQIELSEDEPQLNVTLVEYLNQKFNIDLRHLINLPKDDKGVDIKKIIVSIRHAIMDKKGWDVEEIAVISNFSFKKFVMWNDLQLRKNEIISNPNVEALISGNYKLNRNIENIEAKSIENTVKPYDLKLGSLVDSSQLEAIKASEESSFVLHGPPGTGKSQTITNMIIHNLNRGKKVLFVAEKKAALDVVKDRISSLGLEDFVLELHSNKTNKKRFLDKIEKTISQNRESTLLNIREKSESLYELKKHLSKYVECLHEKRNSGLSLYDLIQKNEKYLEVKTSIINKEKIVKQLSHDDLDSIRVKSIAIDNSTNKLSYEMANHPLSPFKISQYSISKRNNFNNIIQIFIDSYKDSVNQFAILFNNNNNELNIGAILKYSKILNLVDEYEGSMVINNMVLDTKKVSLKLAYDFAYSTLTKYRMLKEEINNKYKKSVLDINIIELLNDYNHLYNSKILFKNKKVKSLITVLSNELITARELSEKEFHEDLKLIDEFHKVRQTLQNRNDNFIDSFGDAWKGRITNLEELKYLINFIEDNNIKDFDKQDKKILIKLVNLKVKENDSYVEFKSSVERLKDCTNDLILNYNIDKNYLFEICSKNIRTITNNWLSAIIDLKNWSIINEQFEDLEDILKIEIKNKFLENNNCFNLEQQLYKSIIDQLIKHYFKSDEILDSFNGYDFDEKIKLLKEKVNEFNELSIIDTKNYIGLNLLNKRNNENNLDEFLALQKAIRSKGRGQSIRTIFNKTSNIIQDIFPIMLMSPLSTAQYIDPNFPKFDLIIFDEASQIPTDISVGAISRAKNCVVVGDPKQMPPTSFFSSNIMNEDNLELEDLESLLDDCLAANFPEKHLKWHYRSEHESLIHFSNRTYYNSNLLTYPSPTNVKSLVKFKNIKGTYKRGSERVNEEEANYIVNLLIKHMKSKSSDSIGVVTFNIQQQNLIENLLEDELIKNKELDEKYLNASEKIFIKNLENVQGDERDIILFSTTFGPDEDGYMTMNFGPLNINGGWRRLNVAITRARKEMIVVSSFNPEDIDLNRTKAEGVKGLKGFLEYAQNYKMLPPINKNLFGNTNNIIFAIQKELEKYGYNSLINIGNSEFKIDLGVLNPKDENQFILGILLDGDNYYASKTAIDRNVVQPYILNKLGWHIDNIWSIDWYEDKNQVINNVLNKLKEIEEEI